MSTKHNFEYIVIGSGPAGSAAAINLAQAKKRVALVEGRYFGGSNINTRNIPYAVALNFSHLYSRMLFAPELKNQDFSFSLSSVVSHQLRTTLTASQRHREACEKAGVICLEGYANFLDKHTVAIGAQKFTADYFILATGSRPTVPNIAGIDTIQYYTANTAIQIRRRPNVALIIGGGPTGCELATYFAELGIKVIIMEAASRLLPHEDKDASKAVTEHLANHLGAMVLTSSTAIAAEPDEAGTRIIFRNNRSEKMVLVDCVILATGSRPSLNYGLENAGIKYTNAGITTDKFYTTSVKHIYAIGDARSKSPELHSTTELTEYEGSLLSANLINKSKTIPNYTGFTYCTLSSPEVAVVGQSEDNLIERKRKYKKSLVRLSDLPIASTLDATDGFVKLITDRNDHIIGAVIAMPGASLLAGEIALAIRHKLTALELASTPHLVNSCGYAIKLAAKKILTKK